MKRSVFLNVVALLSLTVVLPSLAHADAPKGHSREKDEAALRKLVAEQTDAWNRHDAAAWCKDFAPDAEFINIVGMVLTGKEEIQKRHAAIFEKIFKDSRTTVTVRRIVFPSPDVAIVDMVHEVTGYGALPPGVQATEPGLLRTQMKFVLGRTKDGSWKILAAQNTDVKPAPGAPPAPAKPVTK